MVASFLQSWLPAAGSQESDDISYWLPAGWQPGRDDISCWLPACWQPGKGWHLMLAASLLVARKAMTSCWQPFVHFFTLNFLLGFFVNQNVSCNLALGCWLEKDLCLQEKLNPHEDSLLQSSIQCLIINLLFYLKTSEGKFDPWWPECAAGWIKSNWRISFANKFNVIRTYSNAPLQTFLLVLFHLQVGSKHFAWPAIFTLATWGMVSRKKKRNQGMRSQKQPEILSGMVFWRLESYNL